IKACEEADCRLEACWGDRRFRPRYCARHKKQGSSIMDPVEVEEGEEAVEEDENYASSSHSPLEPDPEAEPVADGDINAK
ncbi:unnamed protein product, partial [Discosporangium mesarthrocarpum]